MSDIFQNAADKYKGSPAVVILFVLSVVMFLIGANHFVEDTYSSKLGLEQLQNAYSLQIQIFDWSYWTMSLAPQIASMVFFYLFLSNTSKKTYFLLALGSQLMDFFADSWYRSNGNLFDNLGVFVISALLTFVYYSVGSEFFLSVGLGLILKLFAPALQTWNVAMKNIKDAGKGGLSPNSFPPKSNQQPFNPGGQRPAHHNFSGNGKNGDSKSGDTQPKFNPNQRKSINISDDLREKLGKGR